MTAVARRFEFEFRPGTAGLLRVWGVRPSTAYVEVTSTELRARFGFLSMSTPMSNVAGAEETGPYQLFRALGPRMSIKDRGATFGTSTRGVCIKFHEPERVLFPAKIHPALTVTVADRSGLVAAIEDYEKRSNAG